MIQNTNTIPWVLYACSHLRKQNAVGSLVEAGLEMQASILFFFFLFLLAN